MSQSRNGGDGVVFDKSAYRELLCEYVPTPIDNRDDYDRACQLLAGLSATEPEVVRLRKLLLLCIRDYRTEKLEPETARNLIKERMKAFGITQQQLADNTGLTQSMISAVLKGERQLGQRAGERVAGYLEFPVAALGSHYLR